MFSLRAGSLSLDLRPPLHAWYTYSPSSPPRGSSVHWAWLLISLLAFWAALSGELHNAFLVGSGAVTCIAVTGIAVRGGLIVSDWGFGRLLLAVVRYLPWLLLQIVAANVRMIRTVWDPTLPIDPRSATVPVELHTPTGRATFANSITLTPGTVTIDAPPEQFLVHALLPSDVEDLLAGDMQRRVAALEPGAKRER